MYLNLRPILFLLLTLQICSDLLLPQHALAMPRHAAVIEHVQQTPGVVYNVTQDQHDFMWLAADFDGLLRFDGEHFVRFAPPGTNALTVNQIVADQHDQLWIGTWGNGLWRLNHLRNEWLQIHSSLPANARVQSLHFGQDQSLWIGTTQGLYRLRPDTLRTELWQPLAGQRIWNIAEQDNGHIWVATSNGLYQLEPQDQNASKWLELAAFHGKEIRTLAVQEQHLLVGLRSRLVLFDISNMAVLEQLEFGNPNAILTNSADAWLVGSIDGLFSVRLVGTKLQSERLRAEVDVRSFFRDRQNQVWLTSRNLGLQRMSPPALQPVTPSLDAFINEANTHRLGPFSVTQTRWQALENSLLQLHNNQWRELKFKTDTPVAYVREVIQFGEHTLAATDQGLFKLEADNLFGKVPLNLNSNRQEVETMAVAADGALWLSLREIGIVRIAAENAIKEPTSWQADRLPTDFHELEWVIAMHKDSQQGLWLLSRHGKLYQATADAFKLRWQPDSSLTTGYYRCMLPEPDALWLCTDRGLLRVNPELQQTSVFGQAQGLPDLRVIGIARTSEFIWVLTRNGVLNLRPDGSDLHLLNARHRLDLTTVQLAGLSALPNDQVQLATSSGLYQLSQADMTQVPAALQLHLTSLRLDQQLYSMVQSNDSVVIAEPFEQLQLQFKLLTYQPHLRVQYYFRWHENQEWSALGEEAVLNLSQLSPGLHQLEVMAQAGGQYVKIQPLRLQIPIPFWRSPAGIVFFSLLAAMFFWGLYHLRTKQLQQRAVTLNLLVTQRTAELELANQQLQLLSNTDSLTGLYNRRALYTGAELLQAQRNRAPSALTLVLMDIDHFKKINDNHGHDVGDAVLQVVAKYLKQRLRAQDLIARWGGEEFLLLMPQTDVTHAQRLTEELRHGITQLQVEGLHTPISATFGISAVALQANALDQAAKAADLALYRGKTQGRNQVILALETSSDTDPVAKYS